MDRFIGVLIVLIALMIFTIVAHPADTWKESPDPLGDLKTIPLETMLEWEKIASEAAAEVVVPPPTELEEFGQSSTSDELYLWVAWDANTESDLKGYKIHYGKASGDYSYTVDVNSTPDQWEPGCEAPYDPFNLKCCEFKLIFSSPGTYYMAATAYDEEDNESAYSDELVHTFIIHKPVVTAPTDMNLYLGDE